MSKKKWVTLKYCTILPFDLTTGYAERTFRANGLYDPDYTGVGHQPFGRDKYTNEYRKYVVINSFISVTWCNTISLEVSGPFFVYSCDTFNEAAAIWSSSGIDGLLEVADSKQRAYWGDANNKKTRAYIRWRCPNPRDETWGAETSGDPTGNNQHYFTIIAHTIPVNTIGSIVYLRVELFYRVLFYDPRTFNFSS